MSNPLILIVEDEPELARLLRAYLEREHYRIVIAIDGEQAIMHASHFKPDLIILDIGLPKKDGFEVLMKIRANNDVPVIMATAMVEDIDKISAFRMGADDYVTKPYNPSEVIARVKAILRRGQNQGEKTLTCGPLKLNPNSHNISLTINNTITNLELTLSEYRILNHLMRHKGRVFSRSELLDACLEQSDALERTLDSHIANIRKKIKKHYNKEVISSVRGVGYRLEDGLV